MASLYGQWKGPRRLHDTYGSTTSQLAAGIFITAFGVLLTLDRLQIMDAAGVLQYWPAGLIVLGGTILASRQDAHGRFWGFGWIFAGTWLLLNTLGLVRVSLGQIFWPLILVLIGVNVIRKAIGRRALPIGRDPGGLPATGDGLSLFAMLSESKGNVNGQAFHRASMTALMGGCMLDARQAIVAPGGEAVIDVFAIMGGLEIWVPNGWTVVTDLASIMAGIEDKRLPAIAGGGLAPGQTAPRVVIRGMILLSGLTIKN